MLDILSIGHTNIDLFILSNHIISVKPIQKFGGSASNFAINCSRLGLNSGFKGLVGDDEFGRLILNNLKKEGVKFFGKIVNKQTGFVIVFSKGNYKKFIKYLGANSLIKNLRVLEKARHYHLATPPIELLNKVKGSVSVDPGSSLSNHSFKELLPYFKSIDVFFPNKEEAEKITGLDYRQSAFKFLKAGVKVCVIKLGENGCYALTKNDEIRIKPKQVKVIDTTGAGDAFDSAFIYNWLNKQPIKKCCEEGVKYATKRVKVLGAT